MLPYDKFWLEHEMFRVEAAIKSDKSKKKDTVLMFQWLCCLLLLFFSVASAQDFIIVCPHCTECVECEIKYDNEYDYEMKVKCGTWKCPKRNCGYENDNRIRYCGMCGAERK
jgi:hypothetical protein